LDQVDRRSLIVPAPLMIAGFLLAVPPIGWAVIGSAVALAVVGAAIVWWGWRAGLGHGPPRWSPRYTAALLALTRRNDCSGGRPLRPVFAGSHQ
jgi:hypothetical protein